MNIRRNLGRRIKLGSQYKQGNRNRAKERERGGKKKKKKKKKSKLKPIRTQRERKTKEGRYKLNVTENICCIYTHSTPMKYAQIFNFQN